MVHHRTKRQWKIDLSPLLSGLLRPTEGDISYKGRSLTLDMSDADLDVFRGRTIGCLYQKFNLLPFLSARDNILLGAHFGGVPKKEAEARLSALAERWASCTFFPITPMN